MKRSWTEGAGWVRGIAVIGVVGAACLTRPVMTSPPNLKTNFTNVLKNQSVDKLDLLFMIDNSASMGDKQALLAQAVPDMITRLVTPNCVDAKGVVLGQSNNVTGACATGKAEFPPVHDMHIGIVTSSLGGRGGNECSPGDTNPVNATLNAHEDDQGHLINRGGDDEHSVAKAAGNNFLAWYPPNAGPNQGKPGPANAETTVGASGVSGTLIGDFADMVSGVHEHGCGFEAQNEAWYRFLIQPDPFDHITISGTTASLTGVDQVILAQRKAFLRPDSLLAVIVVTDENEEVANPLSVAGQGWLYENYPWPNSPSVVSGPEGTVECQSNPNDPNCTSCAFMSVRTASNFMSRCPNDPPTGVQGYLDPSNDQVNVRFFNQKQRFGVFAGYPLARYLRGLTQPSVPDRFHEVDRSGTYVGDQAMYANCVNPIFAADLSGTVGVTDPKSPALCALARGPRTADLIYYAAIAGVPHQLLQAAPGDPECVAGTNAVDCPQKDQFTDADWTKMTGVDPENYNFSGADPHMVESIAPRASLPCQPPSASDTCDPFNGREWNTNKNDLQFACIFPFVDPMTGAPKPKDCTSTAYTQACDCASMSNSQNTPLCQKNGAGYGTQQIYGKAYPSIREIALAHQMSPSGGAAQGIVSSLCPIHTSYANGNPSDPLFGYRPAVNAIINRLKNALSVQCLPQPLQLQADGTVPCLILVTMPPNPQLEDYCKTIPGLQVPPADILKRFRDSAQAAYVAGNGAKMGQIDPSTQPICQIQQFGNQDPNGNYMNCTSGMGVSGNVGGGWCYVEGPMAGSCPQQILFTAGEPPQGGIASLQCIEQANAVVDGGLP